MTQHRSFIKIVLLFYQGLLAAPWAEMAAALRMGWTRIIALSWKIFRLRSLIGRMSSVPHWSAVSFLVSHWSARSAIYFLTAVLSVLILYGWLSQSDVGVFIGRLVPHGLVFGSSMACSVWVSGSSLVGCLELSGFSLVGCLYLLPHWSALIPQWSALSECLVPHWSPVWVFGSSMACSVWVSGSSLVGCLELSGFSLVGCLSVWFLIGRMSECLLPYWSAVLSVWFIKCRLSLSVWFPIGRLSELSAFSWDHFWIRSLVGRCLILLSNWPLPQSGLLNLFLVCSPIGRCQHLVFHCLTFFCLIPVSLLFLLQV